MMLANFYEQGLRGCVYEIPLIGPSTKDPLGTCQDDNVIIFTICVGVHVAHYYESDNMCAEGGLFPVDKILECFWVCVTRQDLFHDCHHMITSYENINGRKVYEWWYDRPASECALFSDKEMFLDHAETQGYCRWKTSIVCYEGLQEPLVGSIPPKMCELIKADEIDMAQLVKNMIRFVMPNMKA